MVAEYDYHYHYHGSSMCRIAGGSILIIKEIRSIIFTLVDTIYTMQFAVFFGGWVLFILHTTQYLRGVDTIYTMHYVVFSGVDTKGYWCILSKKY